MYLPFCWTGTPDPPASVTGIAMGLLLEAADTASVATSVSFSTELWAAGSVNLMSLLQDETALTSDKREVERGSCSGPPR